MTRDEIMAAIPPLGQLNRVLVTRTEPKTAVLREASETVTVCGSADLLEALYASIIKTRLVWCGKDPGEFSLQDRPWGVSVLGEPFIEHKGEFYLPVIVNEIISERYSIRGADVPKELVVKPVRRNQGLPRELEVHFHNYKIADILSLS